MPKRAPNVARAEELLELLRGVVRGEFAVTPRQVDEAMEELRRYLPEDVSDAIIEPDE